MAEFTIGDKCEKCGTSEGALVGINGRTLCIPDFTAALKAQAEALGSFINGIENA